MLLHLGVLLEQEFQHILDSITLQSKYKLIFGLNSNARFKRLF